MMESSNSCLKNALALRSKTALQIGDKMIDFKAPYKRVSITDAIKRTHGF